LAQLHRIFLTLPCYDEGIFKQGGLSMKRKTSSRTPFITMLRIMVIATFLLGAAAVFTAFSIAFSAAEIQEDDTATDAASKRPTASAVLENSRVMPQETQWNLVLVNPWNFIPENYQITRTELKNGHSVDERCYPDLQEMMDDCRKAGLSPLICSSYRSKEEQEQLFQNQVNRLTDAGYSQAEAESEAVKIVAVPGTSEHQLGLAVDIVDVNNQNLNETQENTQVQQWLMQNSWKYGFILRYPADKSEITGIIYEPWHYRHIGREAAEYIHEQGICLEEYLELDLSL